MAQFSGLVSYNHKLTNRKIQDEQVENDLSEPKKLFKKRKLNEMSGYMNANIESP
jgi:hypothetical protein